MNKIILYLFFLKSFVLFSQTKNNGLGISLGYSNNGNLVDGHNFEALYTTKINNYLFLEGNLNYTSINNFPSNFDTGSFINTKKIKGEFDSNEVAKLNINLHIEFLNKQKNQLSIFLGPSLNHFNNLFYFGSGVNGNIEIDEYLADEYLGNVFMSKQKFTSLGINYGLFYSYSISKEINLGVKVNGLSSKGKNKDNVNLNINSINLLIIKKI